MLGYEWMIVTQLQDFHDGNIMPPKFRNPQLYWLYFGASVSFTIMEIIGQLIYIPAVRLWYLTKYDPIIGDQAQKDRAQDDDGTDTFEE